MPSYTVTVSADNAIRINNAIKDQFEREGDETDRQLFDRWLKGRFTELVYKHDRKQAQGVVSPDNSIAEIT